MVPTEETTKASEEKQGVSAPAITLPKGGGAIHGMGEKFAANPVTGTGSMSVPIATSPSRSGFGPRLSISYDSGAGNGLFGLGWNLSLPSITRKTDKGLPKYQDADESDVFILSGVEDLVPVLIENGGTWEQEIIPNRIVNRKTYSIQRYRPRIEGLFARIERWTNKDRPEDTFWRSISKDNITTWYGKTEASRIFDPSDPARIFSWLICESYDDKGNVIVYGYKEENSDGADNSGNPIESHAHERNRSDESRKSNRYLKWIRYGNNKPYFPQLHSATKWPIPPDTTINDDASKSWLFEVVFDYGDHDENNPLPNETGKHWPVRNDPFSTYRPGFEVRTYRLCQRVLMFHHFPEEENCGQNCLVRSTDFKYSYENNLNDLQNPVFSFLLSATQTGYKRNGAAGYLPPKSLPPLEFEYSTVPIPEQLLQQPIRTLDNESQENLPYGLDGSNYQWVDLDGEGLSGILTEQADGWFYKRNISANHQAIDPETKTKHTTARFSALERVATKPNTTLAGGQAQFLDLAGDGQTDLAIMEGPVRGFYERTIDEDWETFRTFQQWPNIDTRDPNLKFIDLTGDGHADILISEDQAFVWHASLAEAGFAPAQRVQQVFDEEKGPRLVFADSTQSIFLADLSGDGLTDLVRIRNGEVCYWPNIGYSRFGAKVTMDNAPWFDHPDLFDQRRIRLADIDGSGVTDILYLNGDGIKIYYNQSGNSWSPPVLLTNCPVTDNVKSVTVVDLLGNGTACLVWSSPLPSDARRPMHYLDLMGGQKPHLLIKSVNNLGAETRVQYAPSTKFYLQDKLDGKPWITKLPFPVHVVERVETYDHISCNRFVTRYAYHHGYFDGVEREFRGFGMVEQRDTEQLTSLTESNTLPVGDNIAAKSHVPPVLTKTWFHTGVYFGGEHVSDFFAGLLTATDQGEYFREPGLTTVTQARELLLADTIMPANLTPEEQREANRSLKGAMLRQEVYALDGTDKESFPYTVTEQNFTIHPVQPKVGNPYAVFFTHAREALNFHYERNPTDPRIQHALTLKADNFGNILQSAAIGYGRRNDSTDITLKPEDKEAQRLIHITLTENSFTNPIIGQQDSYRTPLPAETRTYELRKPVQEKSSNGLTTLYRFEDMLKFTLQSADGNHDIAFEDLRLEQAKQAVLIDSKESDKYFRRLIEHVRTLYRKDNLTALLPLGNLELMALPGESYKLAFTPGLLNQVFQRPHTGQASEPLLPNPANILTGQGGNRGGYLQSQTLKADGRFPSSDVDDHWWIPSGQTFFNVDPADNSATELANGKQHFYLVRRYRDPFGQNTTVNFDTYDLLMVETRDTENNSVKVEVNDYRVMQPRLVTDPNFNQTAVVFDTLGMVAGTAVMGKPLPAKVEGDSLTGFMADLTQAQLDAFHDAADPHTLAPALLLSATTRIIYDLDRFQRSQVANPQDPSQWLPPYAAMLARETHISDLQSGAQSKIQISFSYSDGFGREILKKIQAEPEKTNGIVGPPRWVGSGWTIFNNKGKPVRQYEPFFSNTHHYQFGVQVGVSPVLFYDPAERVIVTLHPNHTYEKVVFDPWLQTTYDVNDTVAQRNSQSGDPRTDPDIGGYVKAYFQTQPAGWQTWHLQRIDGAKGGHEQKAAEKTAAHADTPTTAHFDALGRPFLTVARNRVLSVGHPLNGTEEQFATRIKLDIEGNQREVIDAKDRIVMRYAYDMLGNRIYQLSMEAGARWMLNDVTGKPIRAWDSRDHNFTTHYDRLRRPTEQYVRGTSAQSDALTLNRDILVDKIEYGEVQTNVNAEALNLRTRIYRHSDSAGIMTNAALNPNSNHLEAYDFKGNLLRSTRQLASGYTAIPDWRQNPKLDDETFTSSTRYDALNRPTQSIVPHSSLARAKHNIIQPVFNEANLLERVDVWLDQATEPNVTLNPNNIIPSAVGINNIDYDAKGQRQRIDYKNGASTSYDYDPLTFRLVHLLTGRDAAKFPDDCSQTPSTVWPGCQVQNLHYTYDPAGNITHIQDDAQQTIYFKNRRVEPSNDYTYDAVYRLIDANGREHLGQGSSPIPHSYNDAGRTGILSADVAGRFSANDGNAMGAYVERYVYDAVGNFLEMQHRGSDPAHPGWTRGYTYAEASLIDSSKQSNRLSRTTINPNGNNPVVEPYQHDAHGNMLGMPQLQAMQWDYKDQLCLTQRQKVNDDDLDGIKHHGDRTYYVYDAAGQRVRKVTELAGGNITEERIYLGGFELFRRHNGAIGVNSVTLERETLHIMDDKQRIALVETRTLDTAGNDPASAQLIRYQFGNHLGSASMELDHEAQIISYEEYTPYGSSSYQAVRSQTETAKRYRYTGMERDEESGLSYHTARYYAPWLARWTSSDPALLVDGPNLYTYCNARPLIAVDHSGQFLVIIVVVVLIGIALYGTMQIAEKGGYASGLKKYGDLASARDDDDISGKHESIAMETSRGAERIEGSVEIAKEVVDYALPGPDLARIESSAMRKSTSQVVRGEAKAARQETRFLQSEAQAVRKEVAQAEGKKKDWTDFLPEADKRVTAKKKEYKNVDMQGNANKKSNQPLLPAPRSATLMRNSPGTAFISGELKEITKNWLRGDQKNAAVMPKQIAEKLSGRKFNSFAELREAFWKEIAQDVNLRKEFDQGQVTLMEQGYSPFTKVVESTGAGRANEVYNLHHIKPIEEGGSVYDLSNLRVVTPSFHRGQH